jgi:hypothetical protein
LRLYSMPECDRLGFELLLLSNILWWRLRMHKIKDGLSDTDLCSAITNYTLFILPLFN